MPRNCGACADHLDRSRSAPTDLIQIRSVAEVSVRVENSVTASGEGNRRGCQRGNGSQATWSGLLAIYLSAREWRKGQTMTEYALILSAVAVVVYIGYQTMGGDITSLLTAVDSNL